MRFRLSPTATGHPAWLHGAALCCLALAASAALFQRQGEIQPGMLLLGCAVELLICVLALAASRGAVPGLGSLIFWASLLRLAGVCGEPILEDDFYRYLWDGYRFVTTGSPFGAAPAAFFADPNVPLAMREVLDGINYPELPTIYAPMQQALFALSYWIAPAQLWPLQMLLSVIDLALLALLWALGARSGAWLYALSPLVLKEIAFTAHPDGLGIALIVLALWARVQGRLALTAVACGLAAATKVFALVLIPFLLWRLRARLWLFAALIALLVYAPFVGQATDADSLAVFAQRWEFNSALYAVIQATLHGVDSPLAPRLLCGLLYAALWAGLLWRFHVRTLGGWMLPRGDLLIGALLLLSPVINAWYLLWLLPFAALRPTYTAWLASGLVLLSYLHPSGRYELPNWLPWVEFLPLMAALALDRWKDLRRAPQVRARSAELLAGPAAASALSSPALTSSPT